MYKYSYFAFWLNRRRMEKFATEVTSYKMFTKHSLLNVRGRPGSTSVTIILIILIIIFLTALVGGIHKVRTLSGEGKKVIKKHAKIYLGNEESHQNLSMVFKFSMLKTSLINIPRAKFRQTIQF